MYATARAISRRCGAPLKLNIANFSRDHLFQRRFLLDRFCTQAEVLPQITVTLAEQMFRRLEKRWYSRRPFEDRRVIYEEKRSFDSRLRTVEIKKKTTLDGYWQSYKYFADVGDNLKSELVPRALRSGESVALREEVSNTESVAIHARVIWDPRSRRAEAPKTLTPEYYYAAAERLANKVVKPRLFVFSDCPEWAKRHLRLPWATHFVVEGDELEQFDIMRNCRHFIISNSTYSWWAAWLGSHSEKKIYAPSAVQFDNQDILPDDWVQVVT